MIDDSLKKDYLYKIRLINKHNKLYYEKSNPFVSDEERKGFLEDVKNTAKNL